MLSSIVLLILVAHPVMTASDQAGAHPAAAHLPGANRSHQGVAAPVVVEVEMTFAMGKPK